MDNMDRLNFKRIDVKSAADWLGNDRKRIQQLVQVLFDINANKTMSRGDVVTDALELMWNKMEDYTFAEKLEASFFLWDWLNRRPNLESKR